MHVFFKCKARTELDLQSMHNSLKAEWNIWLLPFQSHLWLLLSTENVEMGWINSLNFEWQDRRLVSNEEINWIRTQREVNNKQVVWCKGGGRFFEEQGECRMKAGCCSVFLPDHKGPDCKTAKSVIFNLWKHPLTFFLFKVKCLGVSLRELFPFKTLVTGELPECLVFPAHLRIPVAYQSLSLA